MKLFKKMKKGFTLVELVVVIAVIAILAAVSVGAYFGVTETAKASKLQQDSKQIYTTIQIVGSSNSDNHYLDANGLHVVDLEKFEEALNGVSNTQYEVYGDGTTTVVGEAIVLKRAEVSPLVGEVVYTSFEYYTPTTDNQMGVTDLISGEYEKSHNSDIKIRDLYKTADDVNEAIASALENSTTHIKFGDNIEFEDHLYIEGNKNVILDLNGYTLSAKHVNGIIHKDGTENVVEVGTSDLIAIHAAHNAKVTVTGNGKVKLAEGSENLEDIAIALVGCYAEETESTKITIKNGTFTTIPVDGAAVLYARQNGKIDIYGGTFMSDGPWSANNTIYVFNINDKIETIDAYKVYGGSFYDQDPSNCEVNSKWNPARTNWNYVADGYRVVTSETNNPTIYTVVK